MRLYLTCELQTLQVKIYMMAFISLWVGKCSQMLVLCNWSHLLVWKTEDNVLRLVNVEIPFVVFLKNEDSDEGPSVNIVRSVMSDFVGEFWVQCDQEARQLCKIWPITTIKNLPNIIFFAKVCSKFCQILNTHFKKCLKVPHSSVHSILPPRVRASSKTSIKFNQFIFELWKRRK